VAAPEAHQRAPPLGVGTGSSLARAARREGKSCHTNSASVHKKTEAKHDSFYKQQRHGGDDPNLRRCLRLLLLPRTSISLTSAVVSPRLATCMAAATMAAVGSLSH